MHLITTLLLVANIQIAPGRTATLTALAEGRETNRLLVEELLDDTVIDNEGTWGMAVATGNFDDDPMPEYVCRLSDVGQQNTRITRIVVLDHDLTRKWAQTWGYMGNPEPGTPTIADLDDDGKDEIIVPMVETFFPDPPNYKCRIYAIDGSSGQTKPGWPFLCPGWPEDPYNDVFAEVAVADINGDDELEVVFITTDFNSVRKGGPSCYALSASGDSLWRYEFYKDDTINQHGCWTGPALADLDGDGTREIICHVNLHGRSSPWPLIERRLFIINSDGTIRRQWQTQGATTSQSTDYASPVVADINDDGEPEIVVLRRPGFLDVWDTAGTRLTGFPVDLTADAGYVAPTLTKAFSCPVVADLVGDEQLEIVCGSFGQVASGADWGGHIHAFKADGSPLSGFPVETRNAIWYSPGIGNVDTVPGFEILTAGCDSTFYVIDAAGQSLPGWPRTGFPTYFLPDQGNMGFIEGKIPMCKTPLLTDVDDDTLVEILMQDIDGFFHSWDTDGDFHPSQLPWPTVRLDRWRTGSYWVPTTAVAQEPARPALRIAGPSIIHRGAELRIPGLRPGEELLLLDASGRLLLSGTSDFVLRASHLRAGVYFVRTPGADSPARFVVVD